MRRPLRYGGIGVAAAFLFAGPVIATDQTAGDPVLQALASAAAWRDSLSSYRTPGLPPPGPTESLIVQLDDPPAWTAPPDQRSALAATIAAHQDELATALQGLGATVTFRYRILLDGVAVQAPAGTVEAIAALPGVRSVVPVMYLAPADSGDAGASPQPADPSAAVPASPAGGGSPAHIALIDGAVDTTHPWLGGGIGPTYPIVLGRNLVDGGSDVAPDPQDPAGDAHGTEMASLVLRSPVLAGLAPDRVPRLMSYRVLAPERVDGVTRWLARTDRVLGALEMAVDPNGDGDPTDRPDVILLGLARGFDGGGEDPLARALKAADRLGSVVVVPSGNDGPSFGPAGTLGGPAAAAAVLSVGGLASPVSPRTARLDLTIGPGAAGLDPLPLMGAEPDGRSGPVVALPGAGGPGSGDDPAGYRDAGGASLVQGAIALVSRDGGSLAEKARAAAAAGAIGLAVWDRDGAGLFPGTAGGADWPIPVVGLGARQGAALQDVLAAQPGLVARIEAEPGTSQPEAVASFSSRGPTADGRLKPDLLAPAVDLATAFPGHDAAGAPLTSTLTGTSAAAAEVAALALRLRVDHPDLRAADIRSLIVQAAAPLPGVPAVDQGAGAVNPGTPVPVGPVVVDPPIVTAPRPGAAAGSVAFAVRDLTGRAAVYRVTLTPAGGTERDLGTVVIPPDVRSGVQMTVPAGDVPFEGEVRVYAPGVAQPVAHAAVFSAPPASTPTDALGVPRVDTAGARPLVTVRLGAVRQRDDHLQSAVLHDVAMWLVPDGGAAPLQLAGLKQPGDWPPATYGFQISPSLADGHPVPAGAYRLRVTAVGPDGTALVQESEAFVLP